jgi:phosphopantetheine adenylyltransferase
MNRIQIDVITGQSEVIELTAEEMAKAQAQYAEWLTNESARQEELARFTNKN